MQKLISLRFQLCHHPQIQIHWIFGKAKELQNSQTFFGWLVIGMRWQSEIDHMLGICVTFNGWLFSNSETSKLPSCQASSVRKSQIPIGALLYNFRGKKLYSCDDSCSASEAAKEPLKKGTRFWSGLTTPKLVANQNFEKRSKVVVSSSSSHFWWSTFSNMFHFNMWQWFQVSDSPF